MQNRIEWILPIRTVSEANSSEFWANKAKRHKRQQMFVRMLFSKEKKEIPFPCKVKLTRLAPRFLDSDNLPVSMKYIRDEISEQLIPEKAGFYVTKSGKIKSKKGHADNDPRITWEYDQEKYPLYAVKIEIN